MRKRIIFVLFIISLCLFTSNVLAVDYTEPPYNERETVVVGEPNEPVDSSEYKIDNNSSLKGGGIFKPVEIWSFRIIVILIIGGSIYFIIYKKNKNNKKVGITFMKNKEVVRAIKFTLFSISAGAIELGLYTLLDLTTNLSYWSCYLPALIASIIWNFTLNRNITFKATNNIPIAMLKVGLFYLIFTPASTILGNFLAEDLHWNGIIVTLINMLLNFILEFLYDRFYVFRNSIDTKLAK